MAFSTLSLKIMAAKGRSTLIAMSFFADGNIAL